MQKDFDLWLHCIKPLIQVSTKKGLTALWVAMVRRKTLEVRMRQECCNTNRQQMSHDVALPLCADDSFCPESLVCVSLPER